VKCLTNLAAMQVNRYREVEVFFTRSGKGAG
jgi:hypothetical protein